MSSARYLVGDVFERMAELEDGSVDLVLTSPPFLALRSYLPADHPDKAKEIGSEPTPAAFLDTLLALTAEWRRLLAPHGSIAVELGDTYSGSGGAGGDYNPGGLRDGQSKFDGSNHRRGRVVDHDSGRRNPAPGWPLAKSLCGIPHLYHLSLAYGRNLLTGEPSPAGLWRVRNVVAWCRPNPPVGALGDKFRPATSYMTVACVSGSRYFDLDAVRTEHKRDPANESLKHGDYSDNPNKHDGLAMMHGRPGFVNAGNPAGAPPLDWWEIPTAPYAGSHYATWPPALCKRPIESMVPQRVCVTCGKPSERVVSKSPEYEAFRAGKLAQIAEVDTSVRDQAIRPTGFANAGGKMDAEYVTTGWTDCGHGSWRNGLVLDPFGGSGTTAAVATGCGRDAVLIDLDERNADLARDRVGMFLTVEHQEAVA